MKHLRSILSLALAALLLLGCLPAAGAEEAAPSRPVLDEALEQTIRRDYLLWLQAQKPDDGHIAALEPEDLYLDPQHGYFGNHNGYEIVEVYEADLPFATAVDEIVIDRYRFVFGNLGMANVLYAYKDGSFTPIAEAFRLGLLRSQDIAAIHALHSPDVALTHFDDVDDACWYAPYVAEAWDRGLMNGMGGNVFAPERPMTRGMFVTVLYRMGGDPAFEAHPDVYERPFVDVPENTYYFVPALWAGCTGIVQGTAPGRFSPEQPVTREQAATILCRWFTQKGVVIPTGTAAAYADQDRISGFAQAAAGNLRLLKIMEGDTRNQFLPQENMSRAQCAKVMLLSCKLLEDESLPRELSAGYTRKGELADRELTDSERQAVTDFCVRLTQAAVGRDGPGMLSPVSVLVALGMTANGARGVTKDQLEAAFGMSVEELNRCLSVYLSTLPNSDTVICRPASSVWIANNNLFTVPEDFLQANAEYYGAQIYRIGFDNEGVGLVNRWVSEQTQGLIPRIVEQLPALGGLAQVNTLYLDCGWDSGCARIKNCPFTNAGGETETCSMLLSYETRYLEDEQFTGFVRPMGNGNYTVVGLLPKQGSADEALAGLTGQGLCRLLDSESTAYDVVVRMPELNLTEGRDLIATLKDMGIHFFCQEPRDLSGMGSKDLEVSQVTHKVSFKLDGNGVCAAAATVIVEEPSAAVTPSQVREVKTVTLDRPFLLLVLDSRNRVPLFMGTVNSTQGQ